LLFGILFLSGCTEESPNLYKNTLYGFSIENKMNLDVKEDFDLGNGYRSIVSFLGPKKDGLYTRVVNIQISSLPENQSFDIFIEIIKQDHYRIFSSRNYNLIDEGSFYIDGHEAYYLEFSMSGQVEPVIFKQIMILKEDSVYLVVYSAMESYYQTNLKNFEASLSTFRFTE